MNLCFDGTVPQSAHFIARNVVLTLLISLFPSDFGGQLQHV
jgi:hypothetical protein